MKKIFGLLALFLFFILVIVVTTNFTLLKRAITYPDNDITETGWYEPMVVVPGNESYQFEKEKRDSILISTESLNEIADYCSTQNSSAIVITKNSKLIYENYWKKSDTSSITNSMSMAKTFPVLLTGIAIDEELINSEKNFVADYIEEWKDDDRSKIKIEDLLLMQSGLRNDNSKSDITSDLVQMFIGTDLEKTVLDIPAVEKPATRYEYNNANSQILGILLERVSGKSYAEYLSEKIWKPLGAKNAEIWLDEEGGLVKTFCCFFATARDWAKVGNLFLYNGYFNSKQIVPSSWLKKATASSKLRNDVGYYLRLFQKDEVDVINGSVIKLHGLNYQCIYIIPELNVVFVRVGNRPKNWDDRIVINKLINGFSK